MNFHLGKVMQIGYIYHYQYIDVASFSILHSGSIDKHNRSGLIITNTSFVSPKVHRRLFYSSK